ncbi:MAG: hypothetical protein P4M08_02155 [Oligoflexia bacterium]|nr:hypothetical protein [Oligoflexia bacterium]
MSFYRAGLFALFAVRAAHFCAYADDATSTSSTPYIDSLKKQLEQQDQSRHPRPTPENPQPYIDSLKRKMKNQGTAEPSEENPSPYINQLQQQNPSLKPGATPPSYTEELRSKLGPDTSTGAIEAVKEGHSQLEMKRIGEIHNSFSIDIGTFYHHQASSSSDVTTAGFQTVYGSGYSPDVRVAGEHYFLREENTYSLGVAAYLGIQYFAGAGVFAVRIQEPYGGNLFPAQSLTRFAFVNLPVGVGPSFHLNVMRWVRPYVQFMPTGSIFFESRNDSVPGHHGDSLGYTTNVGVAIMLDWISKDTAWVLYRDYGFKHVYFTAEYSRLDTPFTAVDFQFSGLNLGFSFEF